MFKKWLIELLIVTMVLSFAGVIGADSNGWLPGDGRPFEEPPGHRVRDTVAEAVYGDEEPGDGPPFDVPPGLQARDTVTEAVYTVGRRGNPPPHVWERWKERGVGPPDFVFKMMDSKFRELDADKVTVKGNPLQTDVAPIVKEGRTLVPVRTIAENFGALVDWDQDLYLVIIDSETTTVLLKLGDTVYVVNDEEKEMDTFPVLYQDRTLVSLRFVAEALGYTVDYDADMDQITIY